MQAYGEQTIHLLSMQPVLLVPPGEGTRHVHAFSRSLPLYQRRDCGSAGVGLELVAQVIVVGRRGAEHRRPLREDAIRLAMLNGTSEVLRRYYGGTGRVHLLLDGQWQTRRAAEVGGGDVVLGGIGGVYRGEARLFAQDGRHVNGARLGRRCDLLLVLLLRGLAVGGALGGAGRRRRGGSAGHSALLPGGGALLAALLVAHGGRVVGGRLEAVVGSAQVLGDGGRGAGLGGVRGPARVRAGGRGMALGVVEGRGRGRRLGFGGAQRLDALSPAGSVVVVWDVRVGWPLPLALVVRRAM